MAHEEDIIELARIKHRCLNILPITSFFSMVTLVLYLGYRVKYLLISKLPTDDPYEHWNSWVYLVAELGLFLPNFFNHFLRCMAFGSPTTSQHLRLLDDKNPPRVDLFITCAGEDIDTIVTTTEAACALDYPSHRLRVIVLDDAGSDELAQRIGKLKESRGNVYYTARHKPVDHHFKAGNLNHGYRYVETLPGGPAEFMGALDADMIPDPNLLRALLPHLLQNDNLALAQPPQRFYDVPSHDPLLQGLDVNFKVTEPLKEMMGSTWCGGSGYLIRRSALDSIGGYPVGSVGEDMYCSNILLGKGWQAVYVDEVLQHGRVPESYKAHVKQQGRWHVGRVQTARAMGFYLFGEPSRKMGFRQRGAGLIYVLLSFSHILTTIALLAIPVSLWSGSPLVVYPTEESLRGLLTLAIASVISEWVDDLVVSLVTGYRVAVAEGHATYWIAPYHAITIIGAFLPSWLQKKKFTFTASGSSDGKSERDDNGASPMFQRLADMFWDSKIFLHLIYFTVCSIGVARSAVMVAQHEHNADNPLIKDVILHLGWPPLLWIVCLNSIAIPIRYAFVPPTVPQREQLLKRDPVLRASYPQTQQSGPEYSLIFSQDMVYSFCMVYVLGLLTYVWNMSVSSCPANLSYNGNILDYPMGFPKDPIRSMADIGATTVGL